MANPVAFGNGLCGFAPLWWQPSNGMFLNPLRRWSFRPFLGTCTRTKRDFQNTGMLHILAISGQHIALMAAIGIQTFRLFRLPQRLACLVIALGLGLYGPATGWSPSVVRSIWMFWLVLPALFLRRPMSPWTSFAMATSLSLALDPETLLQVGWQLSYLATLALLLHIKTSEVWADKVLPRLEFPGKVATMLRLSLTASMLSIAVTAATFPLIASSSHVIMPLAPLANLLTVPLGSGLLTSAFLTGAFAPLPLIPSLLGQATGFFAWALATVVHTLALWQGGLIAMPPWPLILGFCWIGIILLWPFMLKREKRFLIFGLVVFVATAWVWQQGRHAVLQPVTAVVLDVGQGQAVLLEINGKAILVDAGPARPDAGLRVILPALRARGWNHLDAVFLSHGDADHIGGLTSLIGELPIGQVVLGGPWAEDGLWPGIEKSLSEHHIPFGPIKSGASILQAGLWHLRILDLKIDPVKSRNDGSAVLVLEGPTGRLVIPGDIGKEPEQILADSVQLWRTAGLKSPLWLVIPHHGSDKTGDTASLVAMHPDVALISVGKKNRYGHPGAHTVAALRGMQIPLFMTHETGAVVLNADIHQAHWASYIQDVD
jgi:competence protein ComEC